jgi:hypothetical protein
MRGPCAGHGRYIEITQPHHSGRGTKGQTASYSARNARAIANMLLAKSHSIATTNAEVKHQRQRQVCFGANLMVCLKLLHLVWRPCVITIGRIVQVLHIAAWLARPRSLLFPNVTWNNSGRSASL